MAGVMYLGNQMVSPVIVQGNAEYVGRELTQGGKYQVVQGTSYTMPDAVKDVGDDGCRFLFDGNDNITTFNSGSLENISGYNAFNNFFASSAIKNINFNSVRNVSGDYACSQLAYWCGSVETISFNSLESITGNNSFDAFAQHNEYEAGSAPIFSFNFDNLKTITGDGVFFQGIIYRKVKNIIFPSLETVIGDDVFDHFYREQADTLETIEFPKLKVVNGSFGRVLYSSNFLKLTTVDFSSLEELGEYGFNYFFGKRPTNISFIEFPKLKKLYSEALTTFAPTSLKVLIFRALNADSFGEYTNQFGGMLSGCSNCTVYFPSELEPIIGDWEDVWSGFGGTDTVVVFRAPMNLTIETIPENATISFNGCKEGNTLLSVENTSYYIVSNNENENVLCSEGNFIENDERTITINMGYYTYNKITINAGSSFDGSKLYWRDTPIELIEEETGIYSCYVNNVIGETLTYKNTGSTQYKPANQSFQTTGEDLTITYTPEERETQTFTRPNLTSNGTLGGSNFAVTASSVTDAYKAVDSSTSTAWSSANYSSDNWYVFYNPHKLSLNSITLTWSSSTYRAIEIVLYGSNDNNNWDQIGSYSTSNSSSYTLNAGGTGFYKYYKLVLTRSSYYIGIKNIVIDALEDISE